MCIVAYAHCLLHNISRHLRKGSLSSIGSIFSRYFTSDFASFPSTPVGGSQLRGNPVMDTQCLAEVLAGIACGLTKTTSSLARKTSATAFGATKGWRRSRACTTDHACSWPQLTRKRRLGRARVTLQYYAPGARALVTMVPSTPYTRSRSC